jgi:hypothetical protein
MSSDLTSWKATFDPLKSSNLKYKWIKEQHTVILKSYYHHSSGGIALLLMHTSPIQPSFGLVLLLSGN